jgi:hypothetical protein
VGLRSNTRHTVGQADQVRAPATAHGLLRVPVRGDPGPDGGGDQTEQESDSLDHVASIVAKIDKTSGIGVHL